MNGMLDSLNFFNGNGGNSGGLLQSLDNGWRSYSDMGNSGNGGGVSWDNRGLNSPVPMGPWDSVSGIWDNLGKGLQNFGMSENAAKAARMAGTMGLGMGAATALSGEGFLPGAGMGLLGGGFGSYLQNQPKDETTGSDKSKLGTNSKLLLAGGELMAKDPEADQQAYIARMLGTLPKAKAPSQGSGRTNFKTNQPVGQIPVRALSRGYGK